MMCVLYGVLPVWSAAHRFISSLLEAQGCCTDHHCYLSGLQQVRQCTMIKTCICVVQVTVVFTNFFTIDDMSLSPDLEGVLSEYIIRRCKDLGAIERVRVFRKAASGVATARFRVPDDAQTAIQRFSGTAVIWGMFAAAEMTKRGPERVAEVEEDVLERAVSLGVRVVGEGGLGVLYGEAGHGMVAVGCADIAGMQRLQLGFDGAAYDGRILRADAVEAFLWGVPLLPLFSCSFNCDATMPVHDRIPSQNNRK